LKPFTGKPFDDFRRKSLKLILHKRFSDFNFYFPTGLMVCSNFKYALNPDFNNDYKDFIDYQQAEAQGCVEKMKL
jgi:hypothetical protein